MTLRHFLVTGRVQGVGFRNYTQKKARQVGVCGWVRNLTDGRVEAVAAASEVERLNEFEKYVRRGPMSSQVTEVVVTEKQKKQQRVEWTTFEIRYDIEVDE